MAINHIWQHKDFVQNQMAGEKNSRLFPHILIIGNKNYSGAKDIKNICS